MSSGLLALVEFQALVVAACQEPEEAAGSACTVADVGAGHAAVADVADAAAGMDSGEVDPDTDCRRRTADRDSFQRCWSSRLCCLRAAGWSRGVCCWRDIGTERSRGGIGGVLAWWC